MAKITFKAKIKTIYNHDDIPDYDIVMVPKFKKHHCDMNAFRSHPKYGSYANSDLFEGILARVRRDIAPHGFWRIDNLPDNVKIVEPGYLTVFEVEV